jgi:hypothetical protein
MMEEFKRCTRYIVANVKRVGDIPSCSVLKVHSVQVCKDQRDMMLILLSNNPTRYPTNGPGPFDGFKDGRESVTLKVPVTHQACDEILEFRDYKGI